MSTEHDYGVQSIVRDLNDSLQTYIEAQYHISDTGLIRERRCLLEEPGTIHQRPYVESTPSYRPGTPYASLAIPEPARRALAARGSAGIFPTPYAHQSRALEAFLGRGEDIVVATGTGSGKTESFLMPILGTLAIEAAERPSSAALPGCRALLLYPMNALVNDQLGRIRRLFGDAEVAALLRQGRALPVRFGSYTGRTSYPGRRSAARDARHIQPIFEQFYCKYLTGQDGADGMRARLEQIGRWPSKDLAAFYGADKVTQAVYQSGKRRGAVHNDYHWDERLLTQPGDRELLTRDEMQIRCPDLLITNYSMLEYMLMRPLERPIFEQTRRWLAADERNQLILVLDEAHMYRGAAGAEVALLIRRFQARLGIPRERMRCILTSASLGEGDQARGAVLGFARDLTGLASGSSRPISLVTGEREQQPPHRAGTSADAETLAAFDLAAFQRQAIELPDALGALLPLARALGWPPCVAADGGELRHYLFEHLRAFGPAAELTHLVSGRAIELGELGRRLFPGAPEGLGRRATESLLALATSARHAGTGRVLLPTRLHLLFRGLPGLHACIDAACTARLDSGRDGEHLLGRLYTEPRTQCRCERRGRVFELLTHRDCGAAFLRAYMDGEGGGFLWHEPTSLVGRVDRSRGLIEVQLLVEPRVHPAQQDQAAAVWIDIPSGRLLRTAPAHPSGYRRAYLPTGPLEEVEGEPAIRFRRCPVCTRGWKGRSKIMDLATKGEEPFANLVKAQLLAQPERAAPRPEAPNGGRKVLLFSDGRQKAARLAMDIPREVERDSFRQAIALAAVRLVATKGEARLTTDLYSSFVSVVAEHHLHLFDGDDQRDLRRQADGFRADVAANGNYREAFADWLQEGDDIKPPARYHEALLRQLCNPFYSLWAATLGYVAPTERALKRLYQDIGEDRPGLDRAGVRSIAVAWIGELLDEFAIDKDLGPSLRARAAGFTHPSWGSDGTLGKNLAALLQRRFGWDDARLAAHAAALRGALCEPPEGAYFLDRNKLALVIDVAMPWYRCAACTFLAPTLIAGCCINCGLGEIETLDPATSEYIRARKGYLRQPVVDVLRGATRPAHVTAEEHTAQLSHRDAGVAFSTTEKYELRFQDVQLGDEDRAPVDVLSCTTTMEVGVDIGSLVAVGLRNVPPQRENYQQRAGRAGRRGAVVSTVMTYGQGGPHDSYYFHHPETMVAGPPRPPVVKVNNTKIARRHVHAYLLQTFFHSKMDEGQAKDLTSAQSAQLFEALGRTDAFFHPAAGNAFTVDGCEEWVRQRVLAPDGILAEQIAAWLPEGLTPDNPAWVRATAGALLEELRGLRPTIVPVQEREGSGEDPTDADASLGERPGQRADMLLQFLFDRGLLPTYAFPIDLCSFVIEEEDRTARPWKVIIREQPQQSIDKALSEYAPGRVITVDKKRYRSGGIVGTSDPHEENRAAALFARPLPRYVFCPNCTYVRDPLSVEESALGCPICGANLEGMDMLVPEIFTPEQGRALDDLDTEQEYTYATSAQFPIPTGRENLGDWRACGAHARYTRAGNRRLLIVNLGKRGEDAGFAVCDTCGYAAPRSDRGRPKGRHLRPYLVQRPFGAAPKSCEGTLRQVCLGTTFLSDLLLVRLDLAHPISADLRERANSAAGHALGDALLTLAQALLLGASRSLDLDAAEFSAGYRLVPSEGDGLGADLYLFDTLAGGRGLRRSGCGQSGDDPGRDDGGLALPGRVRSLLPRVPPELHQSLPARAPRSAPRGRVARLRASRVAPRYRGPGHAARDAAPAQAHARARRPSLRRRRQSRRDGHSAAGLLGWDAAGAGHL